MLSLMFLACLAACLFEYLTSRTGYVGEGKKAFLRLKREVLDQILLRRTKSNRSNDICLPPRIVRVRQHRLDEREEVWVPSYVRLWTSITYLYQPLVVTVIFLLNGRYGFDHINAPGIRYRFVLDYLSSPLL